jgi:hypothetical protein
VAITEDGVSERSRASCPFSVEYVRFRIVGERSFWERRWLCEQSEWRRERYRQDEERGQRG